MPICKRCKTQYSEVRHICAKQVDDSEYDENHHKIFKFGFGKYTHRRLKSIAKKDDHGLRGYIHWMCGKDFHYTLLKNILKWVKSHIFWLNARSEHGAARAWSGTAIALQNAIDVSIATPPIDPGQVEVQQAIDTLRDL